MEPITLATVAAANAKSRRLRELFARRKFLSCRERMTY